MNIDKLKSIKLDSILLVALMLLGVYLRLAGINKVEGMWYDEINTYFIAKQQFPIEIMNRLLHQDLHLPLYYMILHGWMVVFGDSDITLRLLSAEFGIVTLPVAYLIGRELHGTRGGVITLCFFSINSGLIYFSQEVRFYSALVLFCTTSALFLVRICGFSSLRNWIGLVVSNVLIVYISTIGCVFVFIEMALLFLYLIYQKRGVRHFWISCIAVFITCLPVLPLLIDLTIKRSKLLFNYFDWYFFDVSSLWIFLQNVSGPLPPRVGIDESRFIEALIAVSAVCFFIFVGKAIIRNKIALTLFLIGTIPFVIEVVFATQDKFAFNYWHSIFSVPFLIISASYGSSRFDNQKLSVVLVVSYIAINLSYLIFSPGSVMYLRKADGFNIVAKELATLNATDCDIVMLMPFGGNTAIKYDYKARVAPFSLDDYSFFSGEVFENIFEPAFVASLNRDNVYLSLKNFAYSEVPTVRYRNLIQQRTSAVPVNGYFFLVSLRHLGTRIYNEKHMIDVLRAKILNDTLLIMNQDDRFVLDSVTSTDAWAFFRFKRIA